mmetsp:Transcript_33527/g.105263  ORF Transcript_33527/g.105263 Transcript_33527/m.105263 type:complete len:143 (+) Transcript_33527:929-1357(+)
MIFDASGSDVVALLDWELAALGHPLGDLAYLVLPYAIPPLPVGPLSGFKGLNLAAHAIPPLQDVLDAYAAALAAGDRPEELSALACKALPHLDLFTAVSYFRMSAIVRGVYARAKVGDLVLPPCMRHPIPSTLACHIDRIER